MMTLVFLVCFAFIILACVEFAIISRLNQLLDNNEQEIFFLENERDTLRERILNLQNENENLEYEIQTLKTKKTKPKKQEEVVPIKAPNKRGRKPKTKKEN